MREPRRVVTVCLEDWRAGDPDAPRRLTEAIYTELRRLAAAIIRRQQSPQTIGPTELVHELYLQLQAAKQIDAENRTQFLNLAARVMRNVLVDHARKRRAAKRGGDALHLDLTDAIASAHHVDVLEVHDLLLRFSRHYPRQGEVVELRFFSGLTAEETVDVLRTRGYECSPRTVERDWRFARAWLENAMRG
jgi:RNA polymerase sigma factor (TIGR02999 family)